MVQPSGEVPVRCVVVVPVIVNPDIFPVNSPVYGAPFVSQLSVQLTVSPLIRQSLTLPSPLSIPKCFGKVVLLPPPPAQRWTRVNSDCRTASYLIPKYLARRSLGFHPPWGSTRVDSDFLGGFRGCRR